MASIANCEIAGGCEWKDMEIILYDHVQLEGSKKRAETEVGPN